MGVSRRPEVTFIAICLMSCFTLPVASQNAGGAPAAAARETLTELEPQQVTVSLPGLRESLQRDNFSWTPLMVAAAVTPDPDVITALIDAGEKLEARSLDDMTPLMFAAAFNPEPAVAIALIEAGADVEARTRDNWVPGYGVARFAGRPVQVDGLFAGAPGEDSGWTALFLATRYNPGEGVAAALIQAGANPDARDENGATAVPARW